MRARFVKGTKAEAIRNILRGLSSDDLTNPKKCFAAVTKSKIKAATTTVYTLRKQIMAESGVVPTNGSPNGSANGHSETDMDILKRIDIVSRVSQKVGGLNVLKDTVAIIEKVKGVS